jgi:hypothetical protein
MYRSATKTKKKQTNQIKKLNKKNMMPVLGKR